MKFSPLRIFKKILTVRFIKKKKKKKKRMILKIGQFSYIINIKTIFYDV